MNIAIRYYSRGGNTKTVAMEISRLLNVPAETIDKPIPDDTDLLIVGGGVYGLNLDQKMTNYLKNLNASSLKSIAIFTTSGGVNITGKMADIVKEKGIKVNEQLLPLRVGLKNYGGKNEGFEMTSKQKKLVEDFVRQFKLGG